MKGIDQKKNCRDIYSKVWINNAENYYGTTQYHKDVINLLTTKVNKLDYTKILEVACGTGYPIAKELDKKEYNVYGIDISTNLILKMKNYSKKITGLTGDAEKLPFKRDSFHLTYCIQSSWYFPNIDKAMSEMFRVTKDDGYVVIDIMNKFSPYIQYLLIRARIYENVYRLYNKLFNRNKETNRENTPNIPSNVFNINRLIIDLSKSTFITTPTKIKNLSFSRWDWLSYRLIYIMKK